MSTIITINANDVIANSRADINQNFANLNADKLEGLAASVDSELALFSGTGGKTLKRASSTGIALLTSGVLSVITTSAGLAGAISDETGSGALVFATSPTIVTPTIASFVNANHNHSNAAGGGTIAESVLTFTDITTNNVSTSKHGFTPKLPNDATKFLDGTGAYSTPVATSDWQQLGETILGSGATSISVTVAARTHLRIVVHILSPASGETALLQFNSDTAGNYSSRITNGAGINTDQTSTTSIQFIGGNGTADEYIVINVINKSSTRKFVNGEASSASGVSSAPFSNRFTGVWNNTSNQITTITILSSGGGNFSTGSRVTVYGSTT